MMKIPRPRLTVRRLMILVALAGMGLGGAMMLWRRAEYAHAKAEYHNAAFHEVILPGPGEAVTKETLAAHLRMAKYHIARRMKWLEAATFPWLPFEDDPPPLE